MDNQQIERIKNMLVHMVKSRISQIEQKGEICEQDQQWFAHQAKRMNFLANAFGQENFDEYVQIVGLGAMIHNASVFTSWKKDAKDVITLLKWVQSNL
ncbi:MAG: hypothetical protein ACK5XN_32375 [Bacteroidota bacterium]